MVDFTILIGVLVGISVLLVAAIIFLLLPRRNVGKNIREMMRQKKSIEEILMFSQKKKWNEKEVKMYFLVYTMQDFLKQGYNLEEVKSMASDAGWPSEMVDIVSKKLR